MVSLVLSLALGFSSPVAFAMPFSVEDRVVPYQKQDPTQPPAPFHKRGESAIYCLTDKCPSPVVKVMKEESPKKLLMFSGVALATGTVHIASRYSSSAVVDALPFSLEVGTWQIIGLTAGIGLIVWGIMHKKRKSEDGKIKRLAEATERYAKNTATEDDLNVIADFAKDVYMKDNLKEAEVTHDSRIFSQGGPSMAARALHREKQKLSQSYASMSDAEKQDYVAYVTQTIEQLPSEIASMKEKNPKAMFSYNALVTIVADVYGELKEPLAYSSK